MVKGALAGREGPWITAAAGVLYAANLRRSNEAGAGYRFAVAPPALAVLSRIHASLCAGEVPQDVGPDEFAKVEMQMDFPDSAAKRFLPFGKGKGEPELLLGVVPMPGEGGDLKPAAAGWSALLDCKVLVLHARVPGVDANRAPLPEDAGFAALIEGAARQSRGLVACVQWWLPAPPKEPPADKEGNPGPPAIVPPRERGAREQLSSAMVSGYLPATAAALKGAGAPTPASFFAWLKGEKRDGVARVGRRQLFDVGGVEPEYPYDELTALIDHLGKLAA